MIVIDSVLGYYAGNPITFLGMVTCFSFIILSYGIDVLFVAFGHKSQGIIKSTMATYSLGYILTAGSIFRYFESDIQISVLSLVVFCIFVFIVWVLAVLSESRSGSVKVLVGIQRVAGLPMDMLYMIGGLITPKLTYLIFMAG